MIRIDGAFGEGGGQILRTSLALSCVTGQAVEIRRIRAGRQRPGLLRQHLCCVRAAAALTGAQVEGDHLSSDSLVFRPGPLRGGAHTFAVGSAGSAGLVLQTVLPPLLAAPEPAHLVLTGGTHNPSAPPADFLQRSFLPLLGQMGARVELSLERHGFYPAGGGRYVVDVQPGALTPLELPSERGPVRWEVVARVANLPRHIAHREVVAACRRLGLDAAAHTSEEVEADGPGNVVHVIAETDEITEVFSAFGRHGARAERVGREAADAARQWLASGAVVGRHLADQLLLPMALAGGGRFLTERPSRHTQTNVHTLRAFLDVDVSLRERDDGLVDVRVGEA